MATTKIVSFRNIDSETFTTKWGGGEYTFEPGEMSMFEEGIAEKFANDLINKILMRELPDSEITTIHGHWKRTGMKAKIFGKVFEGRDVTEAMQKATTQEAPVVVEAKAEAVKAEAEDEAETEEVEEVVAPKKKKKATTNETSN